MIVLVNPRGGISDLTVRQVEKESFGTIDVPRAKERSISIEEGIAVECDAMHVEFMPHRLACSPRAHLPPLLLLSTALIMKICGSNSDHEYFSADPAALSSAPLPSSFCNPKPNLNFEWFSDSSYTSLQMQNYLTPGKDPHKIIY